MKVGFIGCGNMGSALISAVMKCRDVELLISDKNEILASAVAEKHGGLVVDTIRLAKESEVIFLAVKPNIIPAVAAEIKEYLRDGALIVSMAAGVKIEALADVLGEARIIRIMPNTPVAVGAGMITYAVGCSVTDGQVEIFKKLLSEAGTLDRISEELIDAATAVAGCGPAFVYMFVEAIADAGVQCGLCREKALLYATETLKGASQMVSKSGKHPARLKDEVCSPQGSTIEGVHALEEGGFRAAVSNAVLAAYNKTKSLGK